MKSLFLSIKTIIPYLLLILFYFLLVNFEVRHELKNNKTLIRNKFNPGNQTDLKKNKLRISIPVIPYGQ